MAVRSGDLGGDPAGYLVASLAGAGKANGACLIEGNFVRDPFLGTGVSKRRNIKKIGIR
jgi:hypothetical protein